MWNWIGFDEIGSDSGMAGTGYWKYDCCFFPSLPFVFLHLKPNLL